MSWEHVNSSFIPGVLRAYRITYRITDPRFDQSNKTFLVDSHNNSTVVTGLLGFVDYQVMVNGYTMKDGPVSVSHFKTKEGGTLAAHKHILLVNFKVFHHLVQDEKSDLQSFATQCQNGIAVKATNLL